LTPFFVVVVVVGPTLLLVRDRAGLVFGVFNSKDWRTQKNAYFGDKQTFLFELSPHVEVCRAVGPKENFVFYNSDLTTRGSTAGLGMGGELRKPRVWLDSNLQTGRYTGGGFYFFVCVFWCAWLLIQCVFTAATCETFEKLKGREVEANVIDVVRLEVWGLGGERAAKFQKGQREWETNQVLRFKGAKRSDWDVDRTILEMLKFDFSTS